LETQDAYQSVGPPFLECTSCNSVFSIAKNRTEWELKKPYQRVLFFAKVGFISTWLGYGTGAITSHIAKDYFAFDVSQMLSVPLGITIWFWMLGDDLRRNIRESRARMVDSNHLSTLAKLGIFSSEKLK
jgi:hypothetical protein